MTEEQDQRPVDTSGHRLRQRLWGAAVLIALAVIVLPLLLDGSGSESHFRNLDAMREAPPPRTERPAMDEPAPSTAESAAIEPSLGAARPNSDAPSAWVVQAGSFRDEVNAVALRDRLRSNGFASFVNQPDGAGTGTDFTEVYRVNVGPMISRERADVARRRVDELLGRESFIDRYP